MKTGRRWNGNIISSLVKHFIYVSAINVKNPEFKLNDLNDMVELWWEYNYGNEWVEIDGFCWEVLKTIEIKRYRYFSIVLEMDPKPCNSIIYKQGIRFGFDCKFTVCRKSTTFLGEIINILSMLITQNHLLWWNI